MKFLCLECDDVMVFGQRQLPGDGTLTVVFSCGGCGREIAMLTNPMETQLVTSLGIEIGGRTVPVQPFQQTRTTLETPRADAFDEVMPPVDESETSRTENTPPTSSEVTWSQEATDRLGRVPSFVRGMVKRIYADYARERDIPVVTPVVMDQARTDLGLEGM